VAELAQIQHGVVAHRQLIALGLSPDAVHYRLDAGRLHRIHVGVYAVGHTLLTGRGRWMAAVLACGPTAMLSHRCAGVLWNVLHSDSRRLDVTVPGGSRRGPAGVALHRTRRLHPDDGDEHDRIPVTSLARTLLDLAALVSRRELERAVEAAERLRIIDFQRVEELLDRSRGRRGRRALTGVLRDYDEPSFTRSELERRFLALCRDAGLPRPAVNTWVAGGEADMAWADHRVVVELDGHAFHRTRAAFERDRTRDGALQLAGYRVLRITHRRLEREPVQVARAIESLLERA
jgi:hypothetical protein